MDSLEWDLCTENSAMTMLREILDIGIEVKLIPKLTHTVSRYWVPFIRKSWFSLEESTIKYVAAILVTAKEQLMLLDSGVQYCVFALWTLWLLLWIYVIAADPCECSANDNFYRPVSADNCQSFTQSIVSGTGSVIATFHCPTGTRFDTTACVCAFTTTCAANCQPAP